MPDSSLRDQFDELNRIVNRPEPPSDAEVKGGFDVMPCLILWMPHRVIYYATRLVEDMFGYESDGELAGLQLSVLVPPDKREIHDMHLDMYDKMPTRRMMGFTMKIEGYHRKGHTFPVQISLHPYVKRGKRLTTAFIARMDEFPC